MKNLIIVFILLASSVSAQTELEKQFGYANRLFDNEQYFDAVTEYKRLIFFDTNNEYSKTAHYKIGIAYKYGGFFENATWHIGRALSFTKDNDTRFRYSTDLIRVNLLNSNFQNANRIIASMLTDSRYVNHYEELIYWRGWSEMLNNKWELAASTFGEIELGKELKKICNEVLNSEYNVTFAKVISYIIPGSGQFYSGEYFSGILSLGWCVLWGYDSFTAFANDRVFDGIMVANFLWLRFYRGNVQNAENIAIEKNRQLYIKTVNYLFTKFEGMKP